GDLQSRLIEVKKKEIKMKALVYNLCILMTKKSYFLIIGFLQSLQNKRFIYNIFVRLLWELKIPNVMKISLRGITNT
ncbi:MAG: hypothetical protein QXK21_01560, partial [Candidatus Micrarchaeia archaeon]